MTDITKCKGKGCNMKETCYRFKAPAEELWQSYFSEAPHDNKVDEDGNTECEYYWEMDRISRKVNRTFKEIKSNKVSTLLEIKQDKQKRGSI